MLLNKPDDEGEAEDSNGYIGGIGKSSPDTGEKTGFPATVDRPLDDQDIYWTQRRRSQVTCQNSF